MSTAPPSTTSGGLPDGTIVDGRYRVTRTIGAGGFARVYEARHLVTDVAVALKVLDPKANDTDGTFAERFLREARIAASLQHPNVVRIFDVGSTPGGHPYIAMELLSGHDLGREIALRGPLHPDRVYRLFLPVVEALAHGHRQGIIHKDLKPANLFLNRPGHDEESLVVLDYGVARVDASEVARLTDDGQLLGTPRYLAPEYIKEQRVTPAIDVYQIALIMSEALAAFPAVEGNAYTSMMRHCQGELRLPDVLRSGSLGEVFARATALEPTDRFPNCDALADALRAVELEFRVLAPQPRPAENYKDARSTVVTGEGAAPEHTTDSMPMGNGDFLAASGQVSGPRPMPMGGSLPPYLLPAPPQRARSPLGLLVLLALLVLVAAAVLTWFLVLKPPSGVEQRAQASETPEQTPSSPAPGEVAPSVVVFVSSEPSPATYAIDGEPRGETPAMFELDAGSLRYTLTVELEGYEPFTTEIDASIPGDHKISAQLEPVPQPVVALPEPPPETADDEGTAAAQTAASKKGPGTAASSDKGPATVKKTDPVRKKPRDDKPDDDDGGGGFLIAP